MIQKLHFSIQINASKEKVWNTLWNDASYREWADVFFKGSYAVTDNWKEGSTVHFLVPVKSGIYSLIEKHIPNEFIQFKHIGNVVEGKEQPIDEDSKEWTGSIESYRLTENDGSVLLSVDIDVMDEHVEFMNEKLPIALEKIMENSL